MNRVVWISACVVRNPRGESNAPSESYGGRSQARPVLVSMLLNTSQIPLPDSTVAKICPQVEQLTLFYVRRGVYINLHEEKVDWGTSSTRRDGTDLTISRSSGKAKPAKWMQLSPLGVSSQLLY
jgi:hypothetical protein